MLFRRRHKERFGERVRLWLWPRVSWRRSGLYFIKRTTRLSGTPHAIAIGSASGVFVAFTPFIGFHIMIALAIAWLLRGNLIAGALSTFVGNPATYPFIWAANYEIGRTMLGSGGAAPERLGQDLAHQSLQRILPMIEPMFLGSIPLGLVAGCIAYFVVYKAVLAYRAARRERLAGKLGAVQAANKDLPAMAGPDRE
jgi:uncharacterized protein (DUF2062 family)